MINKKKLLISLFVVFNIFTILFMNRPMFLSNALNKTLDSYQNPQLAYKVRYFFWLIKRYAHLVGLDNRWQMFSKQTRFNWWFTITANYKDFEKVLLPLPRQKKRNFFESEFIDFKEGKFYLNIYNNEVGREAYARYLCRKYHVYDGSPIQSIVFERSYQDILPPEETRKRGRYLDPNITTEVINTFQCPGVRSN